GEIDLTHKAGAEMGSRPGLVFEGPGQLTIQASAESANGDSPAVPVIRLHYRLDVRDGGADGAPWTALTVKAGKLIVKGLRFEVDAHEADAALTALRVRDSGQLVVKECEFIQANAPPNPLKGRLSAILVDGPAANAAGTEER